MGWEYKQFRDEQKMPEYATDDKREIPLTSEIVHIDIPKEIDFCGEKVNLNDPDVRERLDRELQVNTFWHSNTILTMKRAAKWFPMIEKILKEENVPDDFKYLAVIESGLINVVSPAGATGFWQFMPKTAKDFKLEVNKEVDMRYNPELATRAACAYFKKAHEKFGSWTAVAAAYNMGVRGYVRSVEKQMVNNYYELLLNPETSRYVFRILAVKEIFTNPEKYNFKLKADNLYKAEKLKYIEIDKTIENLAEWAILHDINYKILKRHNPWLRMNKLTVKKNKYKIAIPKDTSPYKTTT